MNPRSQSGTSRRGFGARLGRGNSLFGRDDFPVRARTNSLFPVGRDPPQVIEAPCTSALDGTPRSPLHELIPCFRRRSGHLRRDRLVVGARSTSHPRPSPRFPFARENDVSGVSWRIGARSRPLSGTVIGRVRAAETAGFSPAVLRFPSKNKHPVERRGSPDGRPGSRVGDDDLARPTRRSALISTLDFSATRSGNAAVKHLHAGA